MDSGPLSSAPPGQCNYRIEGPVHRLLFTEFPRRVRASFAGATVLDSARGMLLHETALLPQLYVPEVDLDASLLEPTDHHTHCPFKGDASYRSLRVGERVAVNAVWSYPAPRQRARWLAGYAAFYWDRVDAWFDEDEQVFGHLRDPYHRVDVRRSSRRVRVLAGDEVVADCAQPVLLSETGLPNRWYLRPGDIALEMLVTSQTTTVCPYKGQTTYYSLRLGERHVEDVAWCYPQPLDGATAIAGRLCFDSADLTVEVG